MKGGVSVHHQLQDMNEPVSVRAEDHRGWPNGKGKSHDGHITIPPSGLPDYLLGRSF